MTEVAQTWPLADIRLAREAVGHGLARARYVGIVTPSIAAFHAVAWLRYRADEIDRERSILRTFYRPSDVTAQPWLALADGAARLEASRYRRMADRLVDLGYIPDEP